MFVTLSTYFYVGARMLICSRKDVVYTNADDADYSDLHGYSNPRVSALTKGTVYTENIRS